MDWPPRWDVSWQTTWAGGGVVVGGVPHGWAIRPLVLIKFALCGYLRRNANLRGSKKAAQEGKKAAIPMGWRPCGVLAGLYAGWRLHASAPLAMWRWSLARPCGAKKCKKHEHRRMDARPFGLFPPTSRLFPRLHKTQCNQASRRQKNRTLNNRPQSRKKLQLMKGLK